MMRPVGWEALGRWGVDAARIEPLAGGVANDVWSVRVKLDRDQAVRLDGSNTMAASRANDAN